MRITVPETFFGQDLRGAPAELLEVVVETGYDVHDAMLIAEANRTAAISAAGFARLRALATARNVEEADAAMEAYTEAVSIAESAYWTAYWDADEARRERVIRLLRERGHEVDA